MTDTPGTAAECEHGLDPVTCVLCGQEEVVVYQSGDGSGIDGPLGHPDIAFCICGSAWFTAVVSLGQDGTVIAYVSSHEDDCGVAKTHGLICIECGEKKPSGFVGDHPWQFSTKESNDD